MHIRFFNCCLFLYFTRLSCYRLFTICHRMAAVTATYGLTYELPPEMTGKAAGKVMFGNQSVYRLH